MNNKLLDKLVRQYFIGSPDSYKEAEISWLCASVREIFIHERTVINLTPPLYICGDLHGQFTDLLRVFNSCRAPPNSTFLFLGDYVDRGKQSIEVICLLLALKLRYPKNVYMLRGNHECVEMAEMFGFAAECKKKVSDSILYTFNEVFETMPLAAVVGKKIFCVHGGLSPSLKKIDDIAKIRRPTIIPDSGPIADLLWSDPSPSVGEWGPNNRGTTYTWGIVAAKEFMNNNSIDMIIRAHQLAFEGYNKPFMPDERVITIFTASCYAGEYKNKAAYIFVDSECKVTISTLPSSIPLAATILQENYSAQQLYVKRRPASLYIYPGK